MSEPLRKWVEFLLTFDWPATEEEACAVAVKHLAETAVFVHEIDALIPGVETAAGVGTTYTWSFRADIEFLPLETGSGITLGTTGLVDANGNPMTR